MRDAAEQAGLHLAGLLGQPLAAPHLIDHADLSGQRNQQAAQEGQDHQRDGDRRSPIVACVDASIGQDLLDRHTGHDYQSVGLQRAKGIEPFDPVRSRAIGQGAGGLQQGGLEHRLFLEAAALRSAQCRRSSPNDSVDADQFDHPTRSDIDIVIEAGQGLRSQRNHHHAIEGPFRATDRARQLNRPFARHPTEHRLADVHDIPRAVRVDAEMRPIAEINALERARGMAHPSVRPDHRDQVKGRVDDLPIAQIGRHIELVRILAIGQPKKAQHLIGTFERLGRVLGHGPAQVAQVDLGLVKGLAGVSRALVRHRQPQHGQHEQRQPQRAQCQPKPFDPAWCLSG